MKKKTIAVAGIVCFLCSMLGSLLMMKDTGEQSWKLQPQQVGKWCVSQVYPAAVWKKEAEEKKEKEQIVAKEEVKKETNQSKKTKKEKKKKVDNSKPKVIIYHTHSSESYQPYKESNFHREKEEGTVREVGNVLMEELNELGIAVYHDKTIHDRPSYNQSYDRSMETITALMREYPSAECIIDLHRDAAAYTGNVGETIKIDGETVAKYKLVIGQNNDNYSSLMAFAKKINKAAEKMYPGFSGRIIEKEYRYNEYIADQYLLLEVGNNQNQIEDVKATGKYFAHVLAEVLEE